MRSLFTYLALLLCLTPAILSAEDMREVNLQAEAAKQQLFDKAAREKKHAQKQAAESRAHILENRAQLESNIQRLQQSKESLTLERAALEGDLELLGIQEATLTEELNQTSHMMNELIGTVRVTVKDVKVLLDENLQSAITPPPEILTTLSDDSNFPGMDKIIQLSEILFNQIDQASQVQRISDTIIDRDGKSVEAEILLLGPFCAAYRIDKEVGFLKYSSAGKKLYALSKLPPKRIQKQIHNYLDGESIAITMDIGRGSALQQLSHSLSLWEQVETGGPIVWPILVILIFGSMIVIERIFFLFRKNFDSDTFMHKLSTSAQTFNWDECENLCRSHLNKPVARVINAGLENRNLEREEMENVLQEAILREIPPMERFLSTLGMLAAIAPLLGLLGTVTGMIETFHVITLHGTSDARLMSGGISEALVTTMLGLGVAIPLMLAQTLLNRSIEKEIGTMEEKGVAFVNIIYKSRLVS